MQKYLHSATMNFRKHLCRL